MARPLPPPGPGGARPAEDRPHRDPNPQAQQAFGYIVAGVLFYGAIGYGLDRWLGTSLLVVLGIFVGAGLGIYMTFKRFDISAEGPDQGHHGQTHAGQETR
jgi:ATP synthase protein I